MESSGRVEEEIMSSKKKVPVESSEEKSSSKEKPEKSSEKNDEEIPSLKTSPYLNYDDVDDYKLKGYGAQGHLEPKEGRGPGSTDAPTPTGATTRQPLQP